VREQVATPSQMFKELRRYHPRDIDIRVSGAYEPMARPAPRKTAAAEDSNPARAERSESAKLAIQIGLAGGFTQNTIDVLRTIKKLPEAHRTGHLGMAINQVFVARPDNRIIDPLAPRPAPGSGTWMNQAFDEARAVRTRIVERVLPSSLRDGRLGAMLRPTAPSEQALRPPLSTMKTFSRFDEIAMKSSVLLGSALSGIQVATAIPNLVDAVEQDWNLAATTSGRAGVLQLVGGGIGMWVFGRSLEQATGTKGIFSALKVFAHPDVMRRTYAEQGLGAAIKATTRAQLNTVIAAGRAPINAVPWLGKLGLTHAAVIGLNELGYLDKLNSGETRDLPKVLRDAAHGTPGLNSAPIRTGVFVGLGAIFAAKAGWGTFSARSLRAVTPTQGIGMATMGALLVAEKLGKLDGLNKPAEAAAGRG